MTNLTESQKAELFDKIILLVESYINKRPKKKPPKENSDAGTISFYLFSSKYPRPEGIAQAGKLWKSLSDEDRQKAIDYIEPYKKEKYTLKDWLTYVAWPVKYLQNRYREKIKSDWIDYKDLSIFDWLYRLWQVDKLKEKLGDKYIDIFRKWKDSDFYLK